MHIVVLVPKSKGANDIVCIPIECGLNNAVLGKEFAVGLLANLESAFPCGSFNVQKRFQVQSNDLIET